MRSALRYFPVIQNKIPIAELAAGKSVGNVNRSLPLDDLIKALITLLSETGLKRRSRLIQNAI